MFNINVPRFFRTRLNSSLRCKNHVTNLLGATPLYLPFRAFPYGGEVKIRSIDSAGNRFRTVLQSPHKIAFVLGARRILRFGRLVRTALIEDFKLLRRNCLIWGVIVQLTAIRESTLSERVQIL